MTPGRTLGINLPIGQGFRQRDLVALAQHAEEAGLDAVGAGEYASGDALATLAAIATATRRIRLETSIVSVVSRSPALLAMGAATLADLSDGRFVLGLGAGSPVVARFHDQSFSGSRARVKRVLGDVRVLLDGGSLDEQQFRLRIPVEHRIPIMLSAVNPHMIRLAGSCSDGVLLSLLCSPEFVGRLAGDARAARAEAKMTSDFEVIAIQHGAASGSPDQIRRRFRKEVAAYFTVPTYRTAATELVGAEHIDEAAKVHSDLGLSGLAAWIPDAAIDRIFVQGDWDALHKRVNELHAQGADGVRFTPVTLEKGDPRWAHALIDELADRKSGPSSLRAP